MFQTKGILSLLERMCLVNPKPNLNRYLILNQAEELDEIDEEPLLAVPSFQQDIEIKKKKKKAMLNPECAYLLPIFAGYSMSSIEEILLNGSEFVIDIPDPEDDEIDLVEYFWQILKGERSLITFK